MTGTTLRDLARAFAKGELARDDYRRSRSELVASILSGETAVRNIDFPPPIKPPGGDGQDATEPRPRRRRPDATFEPETAATTQVAAPRVPAPPATPRPAVTGGNALIVGGIIGVVAIVAIAVFFIASKPAPEPAAATASRTPAAAAPVEAATPAEDPLADAGRALISQFLQDRNWSSQRLAAFQADWSALIADQQAAALKSADAGRLASAIYQRLLEERALSGLGDAEGSLAKQRELVAFAGAIGINDPRLSVPEPAAAAADVAPAPATTPN